MHRVGLKLWNVNIDYYYKEAKKLYDNGVFDYIELYIVPGNLDKIEKWRSMNIPFDIHAPHYAHGMNLSKYDCYDNNSAMYKEVREYANILKSDIIVFHGGAGGDYKETAKQLKLFNDTRIIIENKPYNTLRFVDADYYVGSKFYELKYIIEYSNVGFCLDVGHAICAANSQGIEPYSYIKKLFLLNPKRIHLSDIHINSIYDEHLNYGKGEIDFRKTLGFFSSDTSITIETNKNSKFNLDDFDKDSQYIKNLLKNNE